MKIIDLHTHGMAGYDTRTSSPEEILNFAAIQGAHGVSAIMPTIYSAPIDEMRKNMEAVKMAMDRQRVEREARAAASRQSPTVHSQSRGPEEIRAAMIPGVHLEGPFLNPSRCGALNPASFLTPHNRLFRRIVEGFEDVVKIITLAPELEGALELTRTIMDIGIAVNMGHSDATFAEAEACFQRGARGITHLFNAMRGLHHREPGIAGFGLLNPHVYVEIIGDPYHLHPATTELVFRVKDPSRIIMVSDSVKETGPAADAVKEASGILKGGSLALPEAAQRLISIGFDGDTVFRCATVNPTAYLGT